MYTFQQSTHGSSLIQKRYRQHCLASPRRDQVQPPAVPSPQPRLHTRCSIHNHTAQMKSLTAPWRASKWILQDFLQSAGLHPCTHPLGKDKAQFASPTATYAYDKERWEGSGCPLGDDTIHKYITLYSKSKIQMQRASKSITGPVLITDQSSNFFAPPPFSCLYICTSPCAGAHQSPQHFYALHVTCPVLLDTVLRRQTSQKGISCNAAQHC